MVQTGVVSTLTPLGRGPGDRHGRAGRRVRSRDRSRLRALIVFLVLIVGGVLGAWYVVHRDDSRLGASATERPACEASQSPGAVPVATIRVRVLNATARNGLAASVAAELRRRGYGVTGIGNDSSTVTGPASVRYGPAGANAARAVAALVPGSVAQPDRRNGSDVDLVLGNRFAQLVPAPTGASSATCATPTASGSAQPGRPTGSPQQR